MAEPLRLPLPAHLGIASDRTLQRFIVEGAPRIMECPVRLGDRHTTLKRALIPVYHDGSVKQLSLPLSSAYRLREYVRLKDRMRVSRWGRVVSWLMGYRVDLEITGHSLQEFSARMVYRRRDGSVVCRGWAYWFKLGWV